MFINIKIYSNIIKLATPIVAVRLLYIAINFIGMLFIAQLGTLALAAGALVSALSTTIMVMAMSPLLAVSIIAGRYFGASKIIEIGVLIRQAWIVSMCLSIIVCIILWFLPSFLVELHQPAAVIPLIGNYFHAMAWGVLPTLLIANCHQLCFATKNANLVIIWSCCTLILAIIFGWILMNGAFGLPALGMSGWAYGVALANWIVTISVMIYLAKANKFKAYKLFNWRDNFHWQEMYNVIIVGTPITLQFAGELLAFAILNLMVGWLGSEALGIQQIILQCTTLALMFPLGGAQACSILISQAFGQQLQAQNIRAIGVAGVIIVSVCMCAIGLIYLLAPEFIIYSYVYNGEGLAPTLMATAVTMLIIAASSQIADAVRNVLIGSLRGLRDIWQPMWINVFLVLTALLVSYYLGFILKLGLIGLNLGFLLAFIIGAILMFWRFISKTSRANFHSHSL